jgi:hypothetical protein
MAGKRWNGCGKGLRLKKTFYQRIREFRGWKKRTSAAKAGYGSGIYGTAEAVPFQTKLSRRLLSRTFLD